MATSTTSTTGAGILDVANKMVGMQFGPRTVFANQIIANGRQHENGADAAPGDPVKFYNYNRLQPNTATLSETASGTAETIGLVAKSVNLLEKGNFVTTTEKLRSLSFDGLKSVTNMVAENAALSTDQYAMEVAETQTAAAYNTYVGQTAKSLITASNVLTGDVVRQTHEKLESANVPKIRTEGGEFYLWFVHPTPFYDLKKETGDAAFRVAKLYAEPSELLRGEYGSFEGFRFITTTAVKTDYVGGEEKQAATTVSGAEAVGATVIAVASGTGIVAGNVININDGTDNWAYTVVSVATNDITIGKAIRKNGFTYFAEDGSGLVTALAGGEAVEESSVVYSNYALGSDAFGYAYATTPEVRLSPDPADAYGRLERVAWYALHGIGEIRPESLHKVYCSSAINPNS
jgi:N4-gp56 family major capsid protein